MPKQTDPSTLTRQSVTSTLFHMAVPMLAGTFASNAYNLTDTWFVSRLGTNALAAMSFTFPVVMILRFVVMGLSTGAMAVIAHALGGGDRETATGLTTHAMMLSLVLSLIIMVVGLSTLRPFFSLLGATGEVLDMSVVYMAIWYGGIFVMAVTTIMGQVLMGTGDTRSASMAMVLGTVINLVLDPLMIFGLGPVPAMGIAGAAAATILSQLISLFFPLYILATKHGLIRWKGAMFEGISTSWKKILSLGVPAIFSNILTPLSMALVTRLIADFGTHAVGATGAINRMESFAFMIPMSIGMSLVPFVAQNFGATAFDRILEAQIATRRFALIYGACAGVLFFVFAPQMSALFSKDPQVVEVMVRYLRIACFGYGFLETFRYSSFYLTGVQKPIHSGMLILVRTFGLLVPLSYLGAWMWGLTGIFTARLITDLSAAAVGILFSRKVIRAMQRKASTVAH